MCDDYECVKALRVELAAEAMKITAHMDPSGMINLPPFPPPISASQPYLMEESDPMDDGEEEPTPTPETGFPSCYEGYSDIEMAIQLYEQNKKDGDIQDQKLLEILKEITQDYRAGVLKELELYYLFE